jgi:hypothetical protein
MGPAVFAAGIRWSSLRGFGGLRRGDSAVGFLHKVEFKLLRKRFASQFECRRLVVQALSWAQ